MRITLCEQAIGIETQKLKDRVSELEAEARNMTAVMESLQQQLKVQQQVHGAALPSGGISLVILG